MNNMLIRIINLVKIKKLIIYLVLLNKPTYKKQLLLNNYKRNRVMNAIMS